jgi:hypothetical protein
MEVLKPTFLDTARHYASLGKHGRQYSGLLTFASLDPGDIFTNAELASATVALPTDGLHESAQTLVRALEGAGDQLADYWTNRVVPYLRSIWPKSRDHMSPAIAESLGRLCVAARDAFPEALKLLNAWLQPLPHPDYLIHRLNEAGLCATFPEQALTFLSVVIGDQTEWLPSDLEACLEAIRTKMPQLEADDRYQWLMTYVRQHQG